MPAAHKPATTGPRCGTGPSGPGQELPGASRRTRRNDLPDIEAARAALEHAKGAMEVAEFRAELARREYYRAILALAAVERDDPDEPIPPWLRDAAHRLAGKVRRGAQMLLPGIHGGQR